MHIGPHIGFYALSENPGQVMLVDFDRGGRDGQVSYPTAYVHSELETSTGDLYITKEHDDLVLGRTLEKLAKQTTAAL